MFQPNERVPYELHPQDVIRTELRAHELRLVDTVRREGEFLARSLRHAVEILDTPHFDEEVLAAALDLQSLAELLAVCQRAPVSDDDDDDIDMTDLATRASFPFTPVR